MGEDAFRTYRIPDICIHHATETWSARSAVDRSEPQAVGAHGNFLAASSRVVAHTVFVLNLAR